MYAVPEISKEDAQKILSRQTSFFPLKLRKKTISLKRIELIYLPFYLLEMAVEKQRVIVSLDGLLGENLFFIREQIEYKDGVDNPVCPFVLPESEAQKAAKDKYRWLQLEQRLRMKQKAVEGEIIDIKKIFYPFWVGYFQRRGGYDFKLMDGVSGEVQGVRMRKVLLKAFRHLE